MNHSAVIEFPSVDGVYNATIADADYDGIYFTTGTHILLNSLFGFAKDDAIDSGSGGAGTVVVSNCWVESALHEAHAWSGGGRQTWTYDTVLMNSGQGLECGWSTGANSPLVYASNMLSLANSIGARFGDNYEGTTGLGLKTGFLTVTNSYILHNYRDVFGRPWDDTWNYRVASMDLRNNYLTAPNTNHPLNAVWNPAVDGPKLAGFMTTPPEAPVGVGLALWSLQLTAADLTNGLPVRLSSFTTHAVTVDYAIETPDTSIAIGTLTFTAGETVQRIFANPSLLGGAATWRVVLRNPTGGELTDSSAAYALSSGGTPTDTAFISFGAAWKYIDDGVNQGTAWRTPAFNDNTWFNGVAQLGYGETDEATKVRRTNNLGTNITVYFRKTFQISDAALFGSLSLRLLRDDAGVVYLNTNEVYRSPNLPAGAINYPTLATGTGENSIDALTFSSAALLTGTNLVAVEIHQESPGSSDLSFDFELTGSAATSARLDAVRFGQQWVLVWNVPGYVLEQADNITGPWTYVTGASPATVDLTAARRFYRLKK